MKKQLCIFTEAQELFILIFVIYFTLIIDRANHKYNPYDTYNAWTGKPHTIRRLMLSWTILHIIPLLNFAIFFIIFGINKISFDPNFLEVINIVLVDLLAFFILDIIMFLKLRKSMISKPQK